MRLVMWIVAFVALALAIDKACAAPNNFRLFQETGGQYSSSIRLAPAYVDARSLAASVAESQTVPATSRFVVFSSTCNFYANPTTTATIPGDVTNGSASELNPAAWYVEGVATISVIAPVACVVTFSFYK